MALQKMHISAYVWKYIASSNISKNSALIFLSYFKNKYFLEHLTIVTSGNVAKYVVLHQYEQKYIWYTGI